MDMDSKTNGIDWIDDDITFLQFLYYINGFYPEELSRYRQGINNPYGKHLLHVLQERVFDTAEQKRALEGLARDKIVEQDSSSHWRLTPFGIKVAYNLNEYDIQVKSGYWDFVSRYLNRDEGLNVLDIGCAGGISYIAAEQAGLFRKSKRYGVDIDETAIQSGRFLLDKMWPEAGIKLICANAIESLPLEEQSMDVIISRGTMHYIHPQLFMDTVKRYLKPKGYFFIQVPHWHRFASRAADSLRQLHVKAFVKRGVSLVNTMFEFFDTGIYRYGLYRGGSVPGLKRTFAKNQFHLDLLTYRKFDYMDKSIVASGRYIQ